MHFSPRARKHVQVGSSYGRRPHHLPLTLTLTPTFSQKKRATKPDWRVRRVRTEQETSRAADSIPECGPRIARLLRQGFPGFFRTNRLCKACYCSANPTLVLTDIRRHPNRCTARVTREGFETEPCLRATSANTKPDFGVCDNRPQRWQRDG